MALLAAEGAAKYARNAIQRHSVAVYFLMLDTAATWRTT